MIPKMIRQSDILDALRDGKLELPPLRLRFAKAPPADDDHVRKPRPDAHVDVMWEDRVFRFVAEVRVQATPRTFRNAVELARTFADESGLQPMLLTSFLSPDRLEALQSRGVSGVDLCGNGVVIVPGDVLVLRTGHPNRYPADRTIRNIYQGASSLVARVFLVCPSFDSVQDVMDEVGRRGGQVSLSTVSKVLKVLEEDLVIGRDGRKSTLLQPAELLDRLANAYRPPVIAARGQYRWIADPDDLLPGLTDAADRLVLTGAASVERYAVMPGEKTVRCYCASIESIERMFAGRIEESSRFPDLELIETRDPTVFFDHRQTGGLATASPTQSWLELQAGDKRQRDAASTVLNRLLLELKDTGWIPR
jgi:hypothetical protein